MIKKSIMALIVIVAIVGIAFATLNLKNTNTNNMSNNTKIPEKQVSSLIKTTPNNSTSHNTNTLTGNTPTLISPAEAQKIANTYINSPGAAAGTPKLDNQSGKLIYIVPVFDNGTNVGEIDIDAQNGQNLGGAGGAP